MDDAGCVALARMGVTTDALLSDILLELRTIRQLLEGQQQRANSHHGSNLPSAWGTLLSRTDRAALGRILPAIAGAIGSEWFACRDLEEEDSAALRLVLKGLSTKSVGRLFRRGLGHPVDGYLIERKDRELGVWLWRIVSCG